MRRKRYYNDLLLSFQYINRKHCAQAGVHVVRYAGIHGSKEYGACSVCLSGGYEDDADKGDILYVALPLGVCY